MKALLVIGSIVAALAAAGTAGAGGKGAYVYSSSSCSQTPFGPICLDHRAVTQLVDTPSGNETYVTNGTSSLSFTNPFTGCSVSTSQSFHLHFADAPDDIRSHGMRTTATSQIGCGGSVQTCETTVAFHYGSDGIQFDRSDVVCTTE